MRMLDINNDAVSEVDSSALDDLNEITDLRQKLIEELSRSIAVVAIETGLGIGIISERVEEWSVNPATSAGIRMRLWVEARCDSRNLGRVYVDYEQDREFMAQAV